MERGAASPCDPQEERDHLGSRSWELTKHCSRRTFGAIKNGTTLGQASAVSSVADQYGHGSGIIEKQSKEATLAMNPIKQKIADGVAAWVREEAPISVKMAMTRKQFDTLVQSICDQLTADDFEKTK